jgi:MOSC domain-containing protein YiiM
MYRFSVTELRHAPVGQIMHAGRPEPSAIHKARAVGPLELGPEGFAGDTVADRRHHGGPEKAVCVYPAVRYDDWRARYGRDLPHSAFGENLLVDGVDEASTCVGDVIALGTAVVQVSQPRVPCYKPAAFTGEKRLTVDLRTTGWTGWYLRVLQVGSVGEGDVGRLSERIEGALSVLRLNELRYGEPPEREALLAAAEAPALLDEWRRALRERAGERRAKA